MNIKQFIRKLKNRLFFDERKLIFDIWNYCQNEMCMRQTMNRAGRYDYAKEIHRLLNIKKVASPNGEYVRIGRKGDGGYVMFRQSEKKFSSEKIAYSFGISTDVSWDMEMADHEYDIYQYDPTINKLPAYSSRFHWKKKGLIGKREEGVKKERLYSDLDTILRNNNHSKQKGMVLKMDIEGCEWDVLADISHETLNQFDQIIFEAHGLNRRNNQGIILQALKTLVESHQCIHIHPNNVTNIGYYDDLIIPDAIEITMLRKEVFDFIEEDVHLPLDIDRPCAYNLPEIVLGNWNKY